MADRDLGYRADGRLQDVLALIQVLGLSPAAQKGEGQLMEILMQPPSSGQARWSDVAIHHPEFFRVAGQNRDTVRLAARHAAGQNDQDRKLSPEFVQRLMEMAVAIHDRESKRAERLSLYFPLLIAAIGAVGSVATALIGILAGRH